MIRRAESVAINGAGPVGSLLAVMLARKGYKVDVFESRPDSRRTNIYQGKSINLALSDRGWLALESIGIDSDIRSQAIPMYSRIMHDKQGNLTEQPYGKDGQAIWSVSRAGINEKLIELAETEQGVHFHFNHRLVDLDFDSNHANYIDEFHQRYSHQSNIVFGADGTFSKVRRLAQEIPKQRTSYSLDYMPQSYIELHIPAGPNGEFKLEKNALHIWPRKDFMLIALPNPDGSFTCTLFMNQEGELSFDSLTADLHHSRVMVEEKVGTFLQENFPDAMPLLEEPVQSFLSKPASALCLVHIYPWVFNNQVALIGDAAHAMVPFYGQGMNCGFEDCRVLAELIERHNYRWHDVLAAYQTERKKNGDAIIELAKRNFVEMSELSGDPAFLLRKKIEAEAHKRFPDLWVPLYSMVTFSPHISYHTALVAGDIQKAIMDEVMALPNIEENWQRDDVYKIIESKALEKLQGIGM